MLDFSGYGELSNKRFKLLYQTAISVLKVNHFLSVNNTNFLIE